MKYLPLLIPTIGLCILIYGLLRQWKISAAHKAAMEKLAREHAISIMHLRAFIDYGCNIPPEESIVEITDDFIITKDQNGKERTTILSRIYH